MRYVRGWALLFAAMMGCNSTSPAGSSSGSGACGACQCQGSDGNCNTCGAGQHCASASKSGLEGCSETVDGVVCCPQSCTASTQDVSDFIGAVSNGPTVAGVTSHWVSVVHCNEGDGLTFSIAADGTAKFGGQVVAWTRTAPDGMIFSAAPDGGVVPFSQLKDIYGSVADGAFYGTLLDPGGGHAGCGFTLVAGP